LFKRRLGARYATSAWREYIFDSSIACSTSEYRFVGFRCHSPNCGYEMFRKPQTAAARARPWVIGGALLAVAMAWGVYLTSEVLAVREEMREIDRGQLMTPAGERSE